MGNKTIIYTLAVTRDGEKIYIPESVAAYIQTILKLFNSPMHCSHLFIF